MRMLLYFRDVDPIHHHTCVGAGHALSASWAPPVERSENRFTNENDITFISTEHSLLVLIWDPEAILHHPSRAPAHLSPSGVALRDRIHKRTKQCNFNYSKPATYAVSRPGGDVAPFWARSVAHLSASCVALQKLYEKRITELNRILKTLSNGMLCVRFGEVAGGGLRHNCELLSIYRV